MPMVHRNQTSCILGLLGLLLLFLARNHVPITCSEHSDKQPAAFIEVACLWHGPKLWSFPKACSSLTTHRRCPKPPIHWLPGGLPEVRWRRVWLLWKKRSCASFRSPTVRPGRFFFGGVTCWFIGLANVMDSTQVTTTPWNLFNRLGIQPRTRD